MGFTRFLLGLNGFYHAGPDEGKPRFMADFAVGILL